MDLQRKNPIHSPCPDMAGVVNFDEELTLKRLAGVLALRESLGLKKRKQTPGCKDFRYSRKFQTMARRAAILRGGAA
ncbi:hypothetical protein [Photobacterium sp. 53610]|uniref:hypothetical protein n=1 Tax=Photobacterium sp. 53610 TaxID=3102789 RepID=UPI002EDB8229